MKIVKTYNCPECDAILTATWSPALCKECKSYSHSHEWIEKWTLFLPNDKTMILQYPFERILIAKIIKLMEEE